MMDIIINPGSGPVNNTSEENAIINLKHFITDTGRNDIDWVRIPKKDYSEGRYAFLVWIDNQCHEIQMPGSLLDRVRYIDDKSQNVWDFPRLYVDGSSWLWCFAIDIVFNEDD